MSQEDVRSDIFAIIALGIVSLITLGLMILSSKLGIECLKIALHAPDIPTTVRVIIGACGIVSLAISWYIAINAIAVAIAVLVKSVSINALFTFKRHLDRFKLVLWTAQEIVQIMIDERKS